MLNPHTSLGIAQIIFYLPMVPMAIYLCIRNGKVRPRMAWIPLIGFTSMRLAGGPVIIALEKRPDSIGLIVSAIILLNVGVVPLIISDLGLIRVILMDNYSHSPHTHRITVALRLTFLAAAILLAGGGGISGIGSVGAQNIGRTLTLLGYVLFALILITLTTMQVYFFRKKSTLFPSSQLILKTSLLASPFIAVRTAYGVLESVFQRSHGQVWNPVYGNAVAFAFVGLLMEYVALCVYFYGGFSISPRREVTKARDTENPHK